MLHAVGTGYFAAGKKRIIRRHSDDRQEKHAHLVSRAASCKAFILA
jgi:hypothetical protein